jgi:ABC-type transporter Mla MlaB component
MATLTQTDADGVTLLELSGGLTHDGVIPVTAAFEAATCGQPVPAGAAPAAAAGPFSPGAAPAPCADPGRVVVDLSDVPVLTTPGLSLLLAAARRMQNAGGRLIITGTRGRVEDLLRRCRLDAVLDIVPDPEEALRKARQ